MCGVPRREIYYYLRSHLLSLLLQNETGICTRQESWQGGFEQKYGVLFSQIHGDPQIAFPRCFKSFYLISSFCPLSVWKKYKFSYRKGLIYRFRLWTNV